MKEKCPRAIFYDSADPINFPEFLKTLASVVFLKQVFSIRDRNAVPSSPPHLLTAST